MTSERLEKDASGLYKVMVSFGWDSRLVTDWHRSDSADAKRASRLMEDDVLPIPADVWERYERAEAELFEAEQAVEAARREARDRLFPKAEA